MRIKIQRDRARVAPGAGIPFAVLDLVRGQYSVGARVDPVLRAGVAVVEQEGRQAGDGVVGVGDAVLAARLGGDVFGEGEVADARGAVCVQVSRDASVAERGRGERGDGTPKGVAGGDHGEGRVGRAGGLDRGEGTGGDFGPGGVEAGVDETAGGEVAGDWDGEKAGRG